MSATTTTTLATTATAFAPARASQHTAERIMLLENLGSPKTYTIGRKPSGNPEAAGATSMRDVHLQDMTKFAEVQTQVNEVTAIMKENVERVLLRDEKLNHLLDKSEELEQSSSRFSRLAKKLKSKFWWQNARTWFIVAGVVVVIVGVIVLIAVL